MGDDHRRPGWTSNETPTVVRHVRSVMCNTIFIFLFVTIRFADTFDTFGATSGRGQANRTFVAPLPGATTEETWSNPEYRRSVQQRVLKFILHGQVPAECREHRDNEAIGLLDDLSGMPPRGSRDTYVRQIALYVLRKSPNQMRLRSIGITRGIQQQDPSTAQLHMKAKEETDIYLQENLSMALALLHRESINKLRDAENNYVRLHGVNSLDNTLTYNGIQQDRDGDYHLAPRAILSNGTIIHLEAPNLEPATPSRLRRGTSTSTKMPSGWDPPGVDQDHNILHPRPGDLPAVAAQEEHRRSERTFAAYDCSIPQDMRSVQPPTDTNCEHAKDDILARGKATYALMQQTDHFRVNVSKCTLRRHTVTMYCGAYDHQTINTRDMEWDEPIAVSAEECRKYFYELQYEVEIKVADDEKKTQRFTLGLGTNRNRYTSHGRTDIYTNEISCEGATWYSPYQEREVSGIVRWVQDDLTLSQDTLIIRKDGGMTTHDSQQRIPAFCNHASGHCVAPEETWIWTPPIGDDTCRLFFAREVSGEEYTMRQGSSTKVVFVDDQRLVRLLKGDPVSICGKSVYQTNFRQFYLYDTYEDTWARRRPIDTRDLSTIAYFNQQDQWLLNTVRKEIKEFVQQLVEQWCKEERNADAHEYGALAAKIHARLEGETVQLDEGRFATASGEIWFSYLCKPVEVLARDLPACYDALPVNLLQQDREEALQVEKERRERFNVTSTAVDYVPLEDLQFFIEPITRRLVTLAQEVPCSRYLPATYRNINGNWMAATPELMAAAAPTTLTRSSSFPGRYNATRHGTFEDGGIYSMEALQRLEQYQMMPRVKDVTMGHLTQGTYGATMTATARRRYILGNLGVPDIQISIWDSLWSKIQTLGSVAAFFIGLYVITMMILRLVRYILNSLTPDEQRLPHRLLSACFPTLMGAWREYQRATRAQEAEQPPLTETDAPHDNSFPRKTTKVRSANTNVYDQSPPSSYPSPRSWEPTPLSDPGLRSWKPECTRNQPAEHREPHDLDLDPVTRTGPINLDRDEAIGHHRGSEPTSPMSSMSSKNFISSVKTEATAPGIYPSITADHGSADGSKVAAVISTPADRPTLNDVHHSGGIDFAKSMAELNRMELKHPTRDPFYDNVEDLRSRGLVRSTSLLRKPTVDFKTPKT